MSYILDALKKLEKERKRGRIPGLSEQDSIVYHSQKKSPWPYIVISVLFLTAGVLIAWFSMAPSRAKVPDTSATTPKTPSQAPAAETKPPAPAVGPSEKAVVQPAPVVKREDSRPVVNPDETQKSAHKEQEVLKKPSSGPVEERQKKIEEVKPESAPARDEPKSETPPEPLTKKTLYKFSELPPSVRESLKKFFTISAYMYSNTPSERMVRINDQMLREGQVVEPGIKIEEILSDGVILTYMKFRFFVSLK